MRRKKTSATLERAEARANAIRSIDARLVLGPGCTLEGYDAAIAELRALIDLYNESLSAADAAGIDFRQKEAALRDLNERMLLGTAAAFGTDSVEIAKAGGVRKSDVVHPPRQARTA